MAEVQFVAYGVPKTKGSMIARMVGKRGEAKHPIVTEENKVDKRIWAGLVADMAAQAMAGGMTAQPLMTGPVEFFGRWTHPCPQSKNPLVDYPASRGRDDGDKHMRSVWDALTDTVWDDDGRVVAWHGKQLYVGHPEALSRPGVEVLVRTIE